MKELKIRTAREEDLMKVASLIAELNKLSDHYIGYCGEEKEEIAKTIREEFTDVPFEKSLVVAERDSVLIGILGFDSDFENHHAEIWGPFFKEEEWIDHVIHMWTRMEELLPHEIETISLFPQKKNIKCAELAVRLGFNKKSEQTILEFVQENVNKFPTHQGNEINDLYDEMKALHDATFPGTYYNGEQIINRINAHRKVFTLKDHGQLIGYIYVEAEPEFGEGSIEFFAVHESYRGKGRGQELLTIGLQWLFSFESIEKITLCVNSENAKAIRLYEKVGFQKKHELVYFSKRVG